MTHDHRPDLEALSRFLDGDLPAEDAREVESHLAGCGPCRRELEALRALVARSRSLRDLAPPGDAWPQLADRLRSAPFAASARRWPLVVAFAAGILATLSALLVFEGGAEESLQVADARYLLLLHQAPGVDPEFTPEEHAAIVARYRAWAQGLGARCLGGEELAAQRWMLSADSPAAPELVPADVAVVGPPDSADEVGGYFVVSAADPAEALRLARDCPHVELGGWIEVRPIRETP